MNSDEVKTLFVLTGAVRKQAFNYLSALPWYAFSKRKAAVRQWRMWYQLEEEYAHMLYLNDMETFREKYAHLSYPSNIETFQERLSRE